MKKKLSIVGTGPGKIEEMTVRAYRTISDAELIVGYTVYNNLLKEKFPEKQYYSTPMTRETERCRYALKKALEGIRTVMICSGDSGIYGMASLVMELMSPEESEELDIDVVPGITAAVSGAALLGSPLTGDFAVISLSDLLTPWETIERRLKSAGRGDFVVSLYNPGSKKRRTHLARACEILMKYRLPDTPCAIAGNIGRQDEYTRFLTLKELATAEADMFMTVFVGNSKTKMYGNRMITPRGYMDKYGKNYKIAKEETAGTGKRLLIFGGTTEGRMLAQTACEAGYSVTLCVATDYGAEVVNNSCINLISRPMSEQDMAETMEKLQVHKVIDATHPYADDVSAMIISAAEKTGTEYIRAERNLKDELNDLYHMAGCTEGKVMIFPDIDAAVRKLSEGDEKIFVSTGSKGAEKYSKIKNAKERLIIRILPSEEAIRTCRNAGFSGKNLICMQGPFGREMNEAMFKHSGADILLTKLSGKPGGFEEKISAAATLGMKIAVVAPPKQVTENTVISAEKLEYMLKAHLI